MIQERPDARPAVGRSSLAVAAGIVGLVDAGLYVTVIVAQGEAQSALVASVAVLIVSTGLLAIVGGLATGLPATSRMVMLGAAAGGLVTLGVMGIFSVGLPLLIAGVLCCGGWARVANTSLPVPASARWLSLLAGLGVGALVVLAVSLG